MVLRKQTVWLITMLSLLIVLSVYYLMSPGSEEVALIPDEDEERQEQIEGDENQEESEGDGTSDPETETISESDLDVDVSTDELSPHELFTTIRLEKEDARSEMKEQLSSIVASSSATTEEKNEAMEEMYALQTSAQKETILEEMIKQEKGFQDVLVRTDEEVVQIRVITEELSKTDANHIMQLAQDEFSELEPRVRLQEDA